MQDQAELSKRGQKHTCEKHKEESYLSQDSIDASSLPLAACHLFSQTCECGLYLVTLALERREPARIKCLFVQTECGVCVFVLCV